MIKNYDREFKELTSNDRFDQLPNLANPNTPKTSMNIFRMYPGDGMWRPNSSNNWLAEGKARSYHLSASTYRRLGEESAYIRQRGFEALQQEQMVVQYLQKYGRITRREVGELCKLGEFQAGRLLKRMLDRGELQLVGAGRGAYYKLAKWMW